MKVGVHEKNGHTRAVRASLLGRPGALPSSRKKLNLGPAEMQFQITINSTVAFSSEFVTFCAIFGRIGRLSSEEVILQLIKSKCVPMLIYGLEVPFKKLRP